MTASVKRDLSPFIVLFSSSYYMDSILKVRVPVELHPFTSAFQLGCQNKGSQPSDSKCFLRSPLDNFS